MAGPRLRGNEPVVATSYVQVIPVPGHTAGSLALLYDQRFLFSGDHLWWDRDEQGLDVPSHLVWNEERLRISTARLLGYSFEWLLPGHGERIHLSPACMKEELQRLLRRRFKVSQRSVI